MGIAISLPVWIRWCSVVLDQRQTTVRLAKNHRRKGVARGRVRGCVCAPCLAGRVGETEKARPNPDVRSEVAASV